MDILGLLIIVLIIYFGLRIMNEVPGPGRATPQNVVYVLVAVLVILILLSVLGHGPMVFWHGR